MLILRYTIELTKFNKTLAELQSDIDRWLLGFPIQDIIKATGLSVEQIQGAKSGFYFQCTKKHNHHFFYRNDGYAQLDVWCL
ncbi:hypothetical protein FACS189413_11130 [Bacteroidia bacterium]|nr:hypothetical protein FACS189463_1720 [Bacteroidia bacterium]GHU70589.1 hypothetical protein FACS189413_11130 [Bacteroidia bacterium]